MVTGIGMFIPAFLCCFPHVLATPGAFCCKLIYFLLLAGAITCQVSFVTFLFNKITKDHFWGDAMQREELGS